MTHTNHYRSFGERLPMVKFTITDDKSDTSYSHATKQIQESLCAHYRYIFLITIHISRNGYDSRNTVRLRIVQTRRETTFLPSPLLDDWQWRDTRVLIFWVRRAYNLRLLIEPVIIASLFAVFGKIKLYLLFLSLNCTFVALFT